MIGIIISTWCSMHFDYNDSTERKVGITTLNLPFHWTSVYRHKSCTFFRLHWSCVSCAGWLWRTFDMWGVSREVLLGWGGELGCGMRSGQQARSLFSCHQAPKLDSKARKSQLGQWLHPVCSHHTSSSDKGDLWLSASVPECVICSAITW